ncbi:MAG: hypothetical protein EHM35_00615 [Planctomycetaceae bacterium]|nr:MAG: hypothetical protein EHM35_00615 [Planctomycetaceae bacterium]
MGQLRSSGGQWLPGQTGNKRGRLPREREHEFLDVTIAAVSKEQWKEIITKAAEQALAGDSVARKFLAEYILGQPAQVHEYMLNEQRDFTIRVVFEDRLALPPGDDVIEGEKVE